MKDGIKQKQTCATHLKPAPQEESGIAAWLTIHSYSWVWMFPWGFTVDFGDFSDCAYVDDYDDLVVAS